LHGGKQSFLGGKVLEEESLGDACRIGQGPRRRAMEALLGKDPAHRPDNRHPPLVPGEFYFEDHTLLLSSCLVSIHTPKKMATGFSPPPPTLSRRFLVRAQPKRGPGRTPLTLNRAAGVFLAGPKQRGIQGVDAGRRVIAPADGILQGGNATGSII